MLYYILGILAITAVHLISFLKCYERGLRYNKKHTVASVLFSIYMIYVIDYLQAGIVDKINEFFIVTLLFIPIGIIMPLIYRRFRYFVINVLFILLFDICIVILQGLNLGKFMPIFIVFTLFGLLIGFVVSKIIRITFKDIRKNLIIKKLKKRIVFLSMEAEILVICLLALFFSVEIIEKVSGKNYVEKFDQKFEKVEENKYSKIYFAENENYERYEAYSKIYPDMEDEEVVWRVNSNLDQYFYDSEYVNRADKNTNDPLLINKFNRVADDFEPNKLVNIEETYQSTKETSKAYKKMKADMKKLDMNIYVVSAYRSVAYQKNLYNNYLKTDSRDDVDTYSARPGYSEHHTGRALDISHVKGNINAFEGSEEADWVYENCHKYGFIVRYKENQTDVTGYIYEPWHITYVGTEISETMYKEKIETLEEYVERYINHNNPK